MLGPLRNAAVSPNFPKEGLKLVLSLALVIFEHGGLQGTWAALRAIELGDSVRLAVPALLFVFQNAAQPPAFGHALPLGAPVERNDFG